MSKIDFENDRTGAQEETKGSDHRLNVSSRVDGRGYYIARDQGRSFTLTFEHIAAAAGEYSMYWRNDDNDRELVISSIGVNTAEAARLKLFFVTTDAADPTGGAEITPRNTSQTARPVASAVATSWQGTSGSGITGITADGAAIDQLNCTAAGHEEFRLLDRIRLGPGDAVAMEYDTGTTGLVFGVVFGYYEKVESD